jgi:hypothetical protein
MRQWMVAGVIIVLGLPVAAQTQRLGDIADEIRLQPDVERVIDEQVVAPSRSTTGPAAASIARPRLAECRVLGGELLTVLRRSLARDLFYDADWREQVREESLSLTDCVGRLDTVLWSGEGADAWREARDAASRYVGLVERMERSMATDTPDYSPVITELERVNASVDVHLANLARAERMAERAAGSEPPTTAEIDAIVARRCGVFEQGSTDFIYCVDSQRRAASRLRSRSRYTVDMDEATFNAARNRCAELHPTDLIERDRCERSRMSVPASQAGL